MFPQEEPTPEKQEEFEQMADTLYQAALDLPFQSWLQLMVPIWERQAQEMRLEGYLTGMKRPED
jgi:hypothetical protein